MPLLSALWLPILFSAVASLAGAPSCTPVLPYHRNHYKKLPMKTRFSQPFAPPGCSAICLSLTTVRKMKTQKPCEVRAGSSQHDDCFPQWSAVRA